MHVISCTVARLKRHVEITKLAIYSASAVKSNFNLQMRLYLVGWVRPWCSVYTAVVANENETRRADYLMSSLTERPARTIQQRQYCHVRHVITGQQ